jgi:hypothetical protein
VTARPTTSQNLTAPKKPNDESAAEKNQKAKLKANRNITKVVIFTCLIYIFGILTFILFFTC